MKPYAPTAFLLVIALTASAQPAKPRTGTWLGTNATGVVLCVAEDSSNPRLPPVLRGWIGRPPARHTIRNAEFDYGSNLFCATYLVGGKTNRVEIQYVEGSETNHTAVAVWEGKRVTFYEQRK